MITTRNEYFDVVGRPTFRGSQKGDLAIDFVNETVWEYYTTSYGVSNPDRWKPVDDPRIVNMYFPKGGSGQGQDGQDGQDATIEIGTITTTTVPSTSPAKVTITDTDSSPSKARFNFAFELPKGEKGDKGDPGTSSGGGGTSLPGYIVYNNNLIETLTEIQVSGTGSNTTVSQSGNTYNGIAVNGSDLMDWANLQYALYLGNQKRKPIKSAGWFHTNRMVDLGKYSYFIDWKGARNTMIVTQNGNFKNVIGRDLPTDMNDANIMIQANYQIDGLIIYGQPNQVGIFPGPNYHANYTNITGWNLDYVLWPQFNLNGTAFKVDGGNCNHVVIFDKLYITGATNSNSQSNSCKAIQCHAGGAYQGGKGAVALGAYASSGIEFDGCIVEGGAYKYSVECDYLQSPNVKDFTSSITHIETVWGNEGGSTEAFYRVNLTGVAKLSGTYSQYQGVLVQAGGVGQCQVIMDRIVWDIPKNGKSFYNNGNASFKFVDCGWQTPYKWDMATTLSRFSGVAVNPSYDGANYGPNTVYIEGLKPASGARVAEETPFVKPVTLTMTMKQEEFNKLHPLLKGVNYGTQTFQCDSVEEAQAFADANPDWDYTIN